MAEQDSNLRPATYTIDRELHKNFKKKCFEMEVEMSEVLRKLISIWVNGVGNTDNSNKEDE